MPLEPLNILGSLDASAFDSELVHYTTQKKLLAILRSNSFWATNIHFLNDSEEMSWYFDNRFIKVIEKGVSSYLISRPDLSLVLYNGQRYARDVCIPQLSEALVDFLKQSSSVRSVNFVTSFCTASDQKIAKHGLLSQWRAYGGNGGYAMVFDRQRLVEILQQDAECHRTIHWHAGSIAYSQGDEYLDPKEEVFELEKFLVRAVEFFIENKKPEFSKKVVDAFATLPAITKHWGFEEEREVRFLITIPTPGALGLPAFSRAQPEWKLDHFERDGQQVPFLNLFRGEYGNLPIARIIVGPQPNQKKRKIELEADLQALNLNIPVELSEIPYRGPVDSKIDKAVRISTTD